jgi:hypothetical protein
MLSDDSALAYSLAENEGGWAWRVYDCDGALVASGLALDKSLAYDAVSAAYAAASADERARTASQPPPRRFRVFGASPPPTWLND